MNQPSAGFWSELVEMNRRVDGLIERVMHAVQPSKPIGREIPFFASIETRFENLPSELDEACLPNADILTGNSVKRGMFTNGSARVYVREIGFQTFFGVIPELTTVGYEARVAEGGGVQQTTRRFNWRWNFQTSIQQRWYADRRVLACAGGRFQAGNHLSFREPLVIEPMETFTFECELLSFGMNDVAPGDVAPVVAGISMILSGYREGV